MTQTQLDTMSREALIALAHALQGKLAKANTPRALSCKVGEKGGVSVYGLNRQFPVSLYLSQWEKLIAFIKDGHLEDFIEANRAKLSVKA